MSSMYSQQHQNCIHPKKWCEKKQSCCKKSTGLTAGETAGVAVGSAAGAVVVGGATYAGVQKVARNFEGRLLRNQTRRNALPIQTREETLGGPTYEWATGQNPETLTQQASEEKKLSQLQTTETVPGNELTGKINEATVDTSEFGRVKGVLQDMGEMT